MKVWTLAKSTLESFLHNRLLLVVLLAGIGIILMMMIPLLGVKATITGQNKAAVESVVLQVVAEVVSFMSGLGSLLAAWAATDSLVTELKAGTVLAVMARPVKRWEFLLGKYTGVMVLMAGYAVMMTGVSYVLAWLGGQHIQANPLVLIAYPVVRYAIYAAIAMLLATVFGSVVSMVCVMGMAIVNSIVQPGTGDWKPRLMWLKTALYYVLPSTNLLSEERYLSLRQAALRPTTWTEHGTSLLYGLDYALVFLLLAMWSFSGRSLRRD
ncbi:MAG TPA: ABC transporter permease subunit [Candidatus Acidoferrum sp.]|nr:ABC transporter permease subunit [Candidatus Acidoferrum sp.]